MIKSRCYSDDYVVAEAEWGYEIYLKKDMILANLLPAN